LIRGKMIAMAVVLLAFPWVMTALDSQKWISVANTISYYIIAALGVQLLIGCCGQVTLGHAAFVAMGAYTSSMMILFIPWPQFMVDMGIVYPLSMLCAGFVSGFWAILFGLPSARVKGFYLIMTTMAAQWITVRFVVRKLSAIGGREQSFPIPPGTIKFGPWAIDTDTSMYYLAVFLCVICLVAMGNLMRSKIGRAWVAIRDNDIAAETMGVNIVVYKLIAFYVAGFFAGIAGSYYIATTSVVSPEDYEWYYSLLWVGIILIGGVGSIQGIVFGSAFMVIVFELLQMGVGWISGMEFVQALPQFSMITMKINFLKEVCFGLAIVFFLIYEPNGLSYRYWQVKNYFNLWPFSYTGKGS
jgi:branched-chain amino acid transport system permease protein